MKANLNKTNVIGITAINDDLFEVLVKAFQATSHRVSLSDAAYNDLTGGTISKERLVEKSFEFLLDRALNTSILREFIIEVIETYFPEYRSEISEI